MAKYDYCSSEAFINLVKDCYMDAVRFALGGEEAVPVILGIDTLAEMVIKRLSDE